jgi:inosine triphosphate pyrophosphatase
VYVKWFLEKTGRKGLVNMLAAYEDKTAYAQCIFALSAGPGFPVHCFVGQIHGKIVDPRGPQESFGWDPVFEPDEGNGKTFAEMTKDEKNAISHRGKALKALCEFLKTWEPEKELPKIKKAKESS